MASLRRLLTVVFVFCGLGGLGIVSADDPVTVTGTVSIVGAAQPKQPRDAGNVAVWLKRLDDKGAPVREAVPPRHFRVVQKDKRFLPSMMIIPVGSMIDFPNEDPFFHNVFSMYNGKRFDLGLYEGGASRGVTATRTGICFIFCNIHPEMSSIVVVVDTPYYAMTDRTGRFTIPRVPTGRYLLNAWHERHTLDKTPAYPREVIVTQENSQLPVILFTESAQPKTQHPNKYGHDYHTPNPPGPLYK